MPQPSHKPAIIDATPIPAQPPQSPAGAIRYDADGRAVFTSLEEHRQFAKLMIDTGLLPRHLNTPGKAILAMRTCKEAGLPWEAWVGKTYELHGQIAVYVEFLRAAAENTGLLEYLVVDLLNDEGEPKRGRNAKGFKVFSAECRARRKDWPAGVEQVFVYTWEDVQLAGADRTNKVYGKHPGDMLMWRAMARTLRAVLPMVCGGLQVQGIDDDAIVGNDSQATNRRDLAQFYREKGKHLGTQESTSDSDNHGAQSQDQGQSEARSAAPCDAAGSQARQGTPQGRNEGAGRRQRA